MKPEQAEALYFQAYRKAMDDAARANLPINQLAARMAAWSAVLTTRNHNSTELPSHRFYS